LRDDARAARQADCFLSRGFLGHARYIPLKVEQRNTEKRISTNSGIG
jgi:hypothetical protein